MHSWSSTVGPLLSAHRGANLDYPENSIAAFRRALELGADVLELDIHATRDGIFVVSHDATGERSAGIPKYIAACDWSEVSAWDAGWGFVDRTLAHPFRGQGMRLPRLEAVLEAFPTTKLNVDVKGANHEQIEQLLRQIRSARAEDRVLLTSFSQRRMTAIARMNYPGPLGFTRRDVVRLLFCPEWISRAFHFSGCRVQVPMRSGPFDLCRVAFIERCHRLGLAVDYWVINDAADATELLARGADGIVTDDVATIANVFRESALAAAWRERHNAAPVT